MVNIVRGWFIAVVFLAAMGCRASSELTPAQLPSSSNSASSSVTSSVSSATAPLASSLALFVLPDAGSKPVLDLLNGSKKSIRMTMYLLTDREVIDALKSARGRGVDVRVLIEGQPYRGGTSNQQTIKDLQAANVSVKTSNPAFRLTHEKAAVIDDRVALIMTANLTHSAFTVNRGYGIIDANAEEVAEIAHVFEADWKRSPPNTTNPNLVWSPINARQRFLSFIDGATQTLDIESEEMQDNQVQDAIVNAVKRGVLVRVVMSPAQTPNNDANAPGLDKIKKGGAQVRLVKTPYIHAKMMVADNARAFVGSENISTVSLDLNRELGILITDAKIIQILSATFAGDWNIGK